MDISKTSVRELAYKIRGIKKDVDLVTRGGRFAFFLGAGASVQSSILAAGSMIEFFKEQIIEQCTAGKLGSQEAIDKWWKEQGWYKKECEYSCLFERFEPKEFGRQRYIEHIIEGKKPSFGYMVLANLMAKDYIPAVITTNFDDLIYSACTSYTGKRPIVYAYGVLASEMRITAQHAKILKLHGDYLYSALKNTDRETSAQDPNMKRQVLQILGEYGLVVVGYGGNDASIIKLLAGMSIKNDLYWCVHRGSQPNETVQKLLKDKKGFLVEIDGFDEMMNEIRDVIGFDMGTMIGSIQQRQDEIIEDIRSFKMAFAEKLLPDALSMLKEQVESRNEQLKAIEAVDYSFKAFKEASIGNIGKARDLYRKSIDANPQDHWAHLNLGIILGRTGRYHQAEIELLEAKKLAPSSDARCLAELSLGELYGNQGMYDRAIHQYNEARWWYPAESFFGLGYAYMLQSKPKLAVTSFNQCLRINPDSIEALNGLGLLSVQSGKLNQAEKYFARAMNFSPEDASLLFNMGTVRAIQGRNAEARDLWKRGLAHLQGREFERELSRALFNVALGNVKQGIAGLKVLLRKKPGMGLLQSTLDDAKLIARSPKPLTGIGTAVSLLRKAITKVRIAH